MTRNEWTRLVIAMIAYFITAAFLAGPAHPGELVTVYKDPSCICCAHWMHHMERAGFSIKVIDTNRQGLRRVNETHSVPLRLYACHTAIVGGYVISGHVPADSIKRVFASKTKTIAGLAGRGNAAGKPRHGRPDAGKL